MQVFRSIQDDDLVRSIAPATRRSDVGGRTGAGAARGDVREVEGVRGWSVRVSRVLGQGCPRSPVAYKAYRPGPDHDRCSRSGLLATAVEQSKSGKMEGA